MTDGIRGSKSYGDGFWQGFGFNDFKVVAAYENTFPEKAQEVMVKDFSCEPAGMSTKYVKIYAKSIQYCPSWHRGAGGKAWLFVDEIMVE